MTVVKVQRCCNGCGKALRDVTGWEVICATYGNPLPDVRHECPVCTPEPTYTRLSVARPKEDTRQ